MTTLTDFNESATDLSAPVEAALQRDALRYRGMRNLVINKRDDLLPGVPDEKTADTFDAWVDAGIAAFVAEQEQGGAA